MECFREIEAIRRPGSPQLEVTKVRGSWRDYLDPIDYSEEEDVDYDLIGCGHFGYDDGEIGVDGFEFEPFSDTCGECENEGEDSDTDMEGLDLTLFEPVRSSEMCKQCCCPCFHRGHVKGDSGYLMMSANANENGKFMKLVLCSR